MIFRRVRFNDNPEPEKKNENSDIPADDGHQMSQNEIDDLIAKLLNQ